MMMFKKIIVLVWLCTNNLLPIVAHVQAGRDERFALSGMRVASTAVLKTIPPPHLRIHTMVNSFNNQEEDRRHYQHRHLQDKELDWTQIGVIDGDDFDWFGLYVDMSADASRIAVNAGRSSDSGLVRVYQRVSDAWIQIGEQINLNPDDGPEGYAATVAMSSANGSRIVVGTPYSVYVYEEPTGDDTAWIQVGNDIRSAYLGISPTVAISANGSRVAVGYAHDDGRRGRVSVFDQPTASDSSDWNQVGNSLIGSENHTFFGHSVAISADGSRVAVGAPTWDRSSTGNVSSGNVRMFDQPAGSNLDWSQVGSITIGNTWDSFGTSLDMSADGNRVVVGAVLSFEDNGSVHVFQRVDDSWDQLGNAIVREHIGNVVTMSADGTSIAITVQYGTPSSVLVFEEPTGYDTPWIQIGNEIINVNPYGGLFGSSMAMSADGNIVVVGDTMFSARVYALMNVTYEAVFCDFSTLTPGVPLTDIDQADNLHDNCFMSVSPSGTTPGTVYSDPPINVFDSLNGVLSKYPRDDPDLGAPNRACGPIVFFEWGPGLGRGGKPLIKVNGEMVDNPYKNCNLLGNLLIIQNSDISAEEQANDSPSGGCMKFEFNGLATLMDFGLLDLEKPAKIKLYLDNVQVGSTLTSPVTGNNGYWVASSSYGDDALPSPLIDSMKVCVQESGAVSFIYFNLHEE